MSPDCADEPLRTAIHFGLYAELFAFHEDEDRFGLDDPA